MLARWLFHWPTEVPNVSAEMKWTNGLFHRPAKMAWAKLSNISAVIRLANRTFYRPVERAWGKWLMRWAKVCRNGLGITVQYICREEIGKRTVP